MQGKILGIPLVIIVLIIAISLVTVFPSYLMYLNLKESLQGVSSSQTVVHEAVVRMEANQKKMVELVVESNKAEEDINKIEN